MVDLKYTQHRMATVAKIQKRIADMKPGEKVLVAELTFIALSDGFTPKTVYDVVDNYKDLGVLVVGYKDGVPFTINKPCGEVLE
jgi:hypothetical protein